MITISGSVERVTYFNPDNGYTVLKMRPDSAQKERIVGINLDGLLTVIGNFPELSPGEHIRVEGDYTTHPKHGLQFKGTKCEKLLPITEVGIERYLGSGLIKGIGPQLAKRIVSNFKREALEIIESDPGRLSEVPGIGVERTRKIVEAWEEQKSVKEIMLFLHEHQVSTNLAVKIYKTYGDNALNVVRENPYQLEQDIYGVGFKTADQIAQNLGLPADHPARVETGIIYLIKEMINEGHVFTPQNQLSERAQALLNVDANLILNSIAQLAATDRIRKEIFSLPTTDTDKTASQITENTPGYGEPMVYLMPFYYSEKGVASCLQSLLAYPVKTWQASLGFESKGLSDEQKTALKTAMSHPVSVLTGGPGTGKTTCLKTLIEVLESNNVVYALASPTGRAAKRLSEATGRAASTIHRLLRFSPVGGYQHNENNPLKIKFLIVDEASMLDLVLTYHLLQALQPGTQVLFVGDVDQLPSVGAGDVLRDIITSGAVPVSRLMTIFRQSHDSQIVASAHRVNRGQMPNFSKTQDGDFFLFPAEDAAAAAKWILDLVTVRMPDKFALDPVRDIQVLSPLYRGDAGVDALNLSLQDSLNPAHPKKTEHKYLGTLFRVGDKVMQIRNNYDKDVFNGDIGYIEHIDPIEQNLTLVVDGLRQVVYDFGELDEIVLAYAISVHKSQGSEFPAIVMPVLTQHYVMLQRNLLYTAITRASKQCVLVGNYKALRIAIDNNRVSQRYSHLAARIKQ
ncbi:MAG TPA: ATP-dependent RecD-like DNA helicase [Brevefilum sp.]|nr:ATP-dependent RecD-like DNA helicase [Brevefilum sp.]